MKYYFYVVLLHYTEMETSLVLLHFSIIFRSILTKERGAFSLQLYDLYTTPFLTIFIAIRFDIVSFKERFF